MHSVQYQACSDLVGEVLGHVELDRPGLSVRASLPKNSAPLISEVR